MQPRINIWKSHNPYGGRQDEERTCQQGDDNKNVNDNINQRLYQ